ncbi:hypothetical protein BH11PLA2_BH11PLA2_23230 [soil metagenome]
MSHGVNGYEQINHGQQVQRCVNDADYVLVNNTALSSSIERNKQLSKDLTSATTLMKGEDASSEIIPFEQEVHMATAYSQSHGSRCLKRHVGAVIVNSDGIPLSLGYNENPTGMGSCPAEYGYCFKDADMHAKLEAMSNVYCPKCGGLNATIAHPWKCRNVKCNTDLKRQLFRSRNMEVCTAIHAEERAIRSLYGRDATNATMYVTTFPCFQCARYIIDAGIKKIVYVEAYPVKESIDFLVKNEVVIEPFKGFKARAFNMVYKGVA